MNKNKLYQYSTGIAVFSLVFWAIAGSKKSPDAKTLGVSKERAIKNSQFALAYALGSLITLALLKKD